jgi:hypothetical protein
MGAGSKVQVCALAPPWDLTFDNLLKKTIKNRQKLR